MVQFSRKLTIAEQKVAHKTIQRNAFYAHPENILRSMLADNDKSLREKAVAKVIELRKEARQGHEEEGGRKRRTMENGKMRRMIFQHHSILSLSNVKPFIRRPSDCSVCLT